MAKCPLTLGGHPLCVSSYDFYEPYRYDVKRRGDKEQKPVIEPPPVLKTRGLKFSFKPEKIGGFFRPFALTSAIGVRFFENDGIFSCRIGDTVGIVNKEGALETSFKISGIAFDTSPMALPGQGGQVVAPVANEKKQLFWQALKKEGEKITVQGEPSRMVWIISDPENGGHVPVDPRKLAGPRRDSKPLNKYEAILQPAFQNISKLKGGKRVMRVHVDREWARLKVEMNKSAHGKRMMKDVFLTRAIYAALFKFAGFSAEEIGI